MCRRSRVASPHLTFATACHLNRRGYVSLEDRQKSFETDLEKGFLLNVEAKSLSAANTPPIVREA
jgi:hypothetical protein